MPQTREELLQRGLMIAQIFGLILSDATAWNNLGTEKQQQLTTGVNKAYGQAMSFQHEFLTTLNAQGKGRSVVTQTHADVTVGQADQLFAKSVECKSVTSPTKTAVNEMIAKAIEQLGGQTGHHPRTEDVRVVDVRIDGSYNPWPLPGGAYGTDRAASQLATIEASARTELTGIVDSNQPGAVHIRNWLSGQQYGPGAQFGRLRDVRTHNPANPLQAPQLLNPGSTRPVFQDASGIQKVRCLTIKIRYNIPYLLTDPMPPNQMSFLSEIVIQVYKQTTGGLVIETAKTKRDVYDFTNMLPQFVTTLRS